MHSTSASTTWSRSVRCTQSLLLPATHTSTHARTRDAHTRKPTPARTRTLTRLLALGVCLFVCLLVLGRHRAAGGYAAATDARYRREPAGNLRDACCVTHAARCMLHVACCICCIRGSCRRFMLHAAFICCRMYAFTLDEARAPRRRRPRIRARRLRDAARAGAQEGERTLQCSHAPEYPRALQPHIARAAFAVGALAALHRRSSRWLIAAKLRRTIPSAPSSYRSGSKRNGCTQWRVQQQLSPVYQ